MEAEKDSSDGASKIANRGGAAAAAGINLAMRYIQSEDGETIDGIYASEIRRFARGLWQKYLDSQMAPKKWGAANGDINKLYNNEMETAFPELRLCENHWKTTHIATQYYPTWRANAKPTPKQKQPSVKSEPQSDADDRATTSSKRSYTPGNSPSKKRSKREREKKRQPDPPRLSPLSIQVVESQS